MGFVEMDQDVLAALLEEHADEDILTQKASDLESFYKSTKCPKCGGACRKEYNAKHAFSDPQSPVARALLWCNDCGAHFDPHSGIRLVEGNLGNIPHPHVVIRPAKE